MLNVMMPWASDLLQHAAYPVQSAAHLSHSHIDAAACGVPADPTGIPDPGHGCAPPGSGKLLLILKWAVWGALGSGVGGFAIIGGRMAMNHRRGEGGGHLASLVIVGLGCVVAVSGTLLVNTLLGN
jgi:hypothetical protein